MITNTFSSLQKLALAVTVVAALALFGVSSAFAQTSGGTAYTTVPSGYNFYANGVYYNSASGLYFNPSTGQYSNLPPLGPAQRDANGNFIVGSGYSPSVFGQYFNSNTGFYYDPMTGMYSTNAPLARSVGGGNPIGGGTFTPGVPNTGAGGEEGQKAVALLVMSALVGLAGYTLLSRKTA